MGQSTDAVRNDHAHHPSMNALQQLIQAWIDAEPERSVRVLARRGKMSHNTIYALMNRDAPASMPRQATLEGLSRGLGLPLTAVREAAADAAGFRVEELDSESQEVQAWVALLTDLPEERRQELWEIGRLYLRRAKEAP